MYFKNRRQIFHQDNKNLRSNTCEASLVLHSNCYKCKFSSYNQKGKSIPSITYHSFVVISRSEACHKNSRLDALRYNVSVYIFLVICKVNSTLQNHVD